MSCLTFKKLAGKPTTHVVIKDGNYVGIVQEHTFKTEEGTALEVSDLSGISEFIKQMK